MEQFSSQHNEDDLVQLLLDYQEALKSLSSESQLSSRQVLRVLRSRDQIQELLSKKAHIDDEFWEKLADLDLELKQKSALIHQAQCLGQLRQSLGPPDSFWWWYLEIPTETDRPKSNWDRFDWLWNVGTVACLVIATSFITQTAKPFSIQGFDLLGTVSTISQGAGLVFVAGGALTDKGKQTISKILSSLKIPPSLHAEATFSVSLLLLVVTVGIHQNLHLVGDWYFKRGQNYEQQGKFSQAFKAYERSLNFSPDDYKTQIAIGFLHEELGNFEQAIEEYKKGTAFGIPEFLNAQARAMLMGALQDNDWQGGIDPNLIREAETLLQRAQKLTIDYQRSSEQRNLNPRLRADIQINRAIANMASIPSEEPLNEKTRDKLNEIVEQLERIKQTKKKETSNTADPITEASTLGEVRENCFYQKAFSIGRFIESPIMYGRDPLVEKDKESNLCFPFSAEKRLSTTPDAFFLSNHKFMDFFLNRNIPSDRLEFKDSDSFLDWLHWGSSGKHKSQIILIQDPDSWLNLAQKLSQLIQQNFPAETNSDSKDSQQIIWRFLLSKDGQVIAYLAYDDASRVTEDRLPFATQTSQKQTIEKLNLELKTGGKLEFADFKVVLSQDGNLLHVLPWQMAYTTRVVQCKEECQNLSLHPRVRSAFQTYTPDLNDPAELSALSSVIFANLYFLGVDPSQGVYYTDPAIFKLKVSSDGQIVNYQAMNQIAIDKFGERFPLNELESTQFPALQKAPYTYFKFESYGLPYKITPWETIEKSDPDRKN